MRKTDRPRSRFGIKTLLLEGGGKINGSFLAANQLMVVFEIVIALLDLQEVAQA